MQLHIINQSPYQKSAFSQAIKVAAAQDAILLVDDGVYALTGDYLQQIKQHPAQWLAINEHLALRGLKPEPGAAKLIDFDAFVSLSMKAQHCLSWY